MAHTAAWDLTDPANTDYAGLGDQEMRDLKRDTEERMLLDHYWSTETDTAEDDADGCHKKITIKSGSAPTTMAGAGIMYSKDVNAKAELFYKDSAGTETQITIAGKLNVYPNFKKKSACYIDNYLEVYDLNNEFDITTKKFTPEIGGHYFLKAAADAALVSISIRTSTDMVVSTKSVYGAMIVEINTGEHIYFATVPHTFTITRLF